jgi:sugar/nucleoside kinase (ribokinase family)
MQATSDIFLGWHSVDGFDGRHRDFYVRQLRDWKGSAVVEAMDPTTMRLYGGLCGWVLARAHARTGDRFAIAAYLGDDDVFEQALLEFAERYADRTERDHASLAEAAKRGSIQVQSGL